MPDVPQESESVNEQRTDAMQAALDRLEARLLALPALGDATRVLADALLENAAPVFALARELVAIARGQGEAIAPAIVDGRANAAAQTQALRQAKAEIDRRSHRALGISEAIHLADRELTAASTARQRIIDAAVATAKDGHDQFAAWTRWLAAGTARWRPAATTKGKSMKLEKIIAMLPDLTADEAEAARQAEAARADAAESGDDIDVDS